MKDEKWFLILPGCDDTNRGDQALIWETVRLASDAGFNGKYFMIASPDKSKQSNVKGIDSVEYLLPHPSTHFKKNNNIQYGTILKIKWALVSVVDAFKALLILTHFGRFLAIHFGNKETKRTIEVFQKASGAFVKGGGFLHSYGGFTSTYSLFYDLYHIIFAQALGVPIYVMPNSYGPFKGPGSKKMIEKILSRCKLVTARESISKEVLFLDTGISSAVYPDLAFYLDTDSHFTEIQERKLCKIPFRYEECVAITMRPYRFPDSDNPQIAYEQYKKTLCDFIYWLNEKGYFPVIVEHTYSCSEHERDMSCIEDVVALLGDKCRYLIYSDLSLNCQQLKYVYSRFKYIIGTRFHSVIFSIATGVPAIAITYGGNKGQGIMHDIGIEQYALEIGQLNTDILISCFEDLEKHSSEVKKKINAYLDLLPVEKENLIESMRMRL